MFRKQQQQSMKKYEKIDFTFIEFSTSKTTEPYEGHFYN